MLITNEMIKRIQTVAYDAYKASGQLAALDMSDCPPEALARTLESAAANLEQGAVTMRTLCESLWPALPALGRRPSLPPLELAGRLEVNEFGWLHIQLETLLPHCRLEPPLWLTDTITRLLDQYEGRRGKLPILERALLVMEELCDVDSRQVYDADNKGWKTVSNALKGRLVADDDQFSLSVCLLARRSPAKEGWKSAQCRRMRGLRPLGRHGLHALVRQ